MGSFVFNKLMIADCKVGLRTSFKLSEVSKHLIFNDSQIQDTSLAFDFSGCASGLGALLEDVQVSNIGKIFEDG